MKLYYAPGACSLSPHIVMREAGIPVQLVKVDLSAKKTEGGDEFKTINSKGYVPTLELPDGQRLTEGPAIVQYLADQVPASRLAPARCQACGRAVWAAPSDASTANGAIRTPSRPLVGQQYRW